MPEHLLNRPQIGSFIEEVSGKGVSQRMGSSIATSKPVRMVCDDSCDAPSRQPSPSAVSKDRGRDTLRRRISRLQQWLLIQIGLNGPKRHISNRHDALLPAFTP